MYFWCSLGRWYCPARLLYATWLIKGREKECHWKECHCRMSCWKPNVRLEIAWNCLHFEICLKSLLPNFFFILLHGNRTLWVRADAQGVQKTGGTQLRQEPSRENKRPAASCINKKQIKDLEEEEKDTALLAGRITILGRFLSFVLKLYCLVSYVL